MKKNIFLCCLSFLFAAIAGAQTTDTITYIYQPFTGDSAWLKVAAGKYLLVYKDSSIDYDEDEKFHSKGLEKAGPRCPSVDESKKCNSAIFEGCVRADVKTTMLNSKPVRYQTVAKLLSVLPSNAAMKKRNISAAENSTRDAAENKNVVIETAYLFAIYKEDDNDYHMIIGSTASLATAVLMNIEVSGLPRKGTAAEKARFKAARKKIEMVSYFKNIPCNPSPIIVMPVPIVLKKIKGSLFWDSQHAGGAVGPKEARPTSAWEIHPVIDLTVVGPADM